MCEVSVGAVVAAALELSVFFVPALPSLCRRREIDPHTEDTIIVEVTANTTIWLLQQANMHRARYSWKNTDDISSLNAPLETYEGNLLHSIEQGYRKYFFT